MNDVDRTLAALDAAIAKFDKVAIDLPPGPGLGLVYVRHTPEQAAKIRAASAAMEQAYLEYDAAYAAAKY